MGFLSDVGRANLLGNVMNYGQFVQQSQTNQLQQKLLQAEITKKQQMSRPMLLSELVGKGSEQRPATMKIFSDAVKMAGGSKVIGPDGNEDYVITQEDLPMFQKFLETRKDLHLPLLWAERSDNTLQIELLRKKLGKGTPAEELSVVDQIEKLKQRSADILMEIKKRDASEDKGFTLGEGQLRFDSEGNLIASGGEKERPPAWKEAPDPDSPTGFSYVDQNTGRKGSPAPPPKSAVEINFDKETIKGVIKSLPKMKEKAQNSTRGLQRIDQMLGLLGKGAGGRMGQIKAWLAPTLEVIGIKSKGLSDAQLYQTLARTLGGSFRMEIVGPGQVSDYENRLLQAISGGGGTATDAARELLEYYRRIAESNISDYNEAVGAISDVSPSAPKVYPKINPPGSTKEPNVIRYDKNGNPIQ